MSDDFYAVKEAAISDAMKRYGMTGVNAVKDAGRFLFTNHPKPEAGYGPGFVNRVKSFGHGLGEAVRGTMVGDPLTMVSEIRDKAKSVGTLSALAQHGKEFYLPKNMVESMRSGSALGRAGNVALLGLNVGLPAYGLYSAMAHPVEGQRGRQVGSALAGLASAPFTSRMGGQFGFGLGAVAGQFAQRAGGAVGSLFDRQAPTPAPASYSIESRSTP